MRGLHHEEDLLRGLKLLKKHRIEYEMQARPPHIGSAARETRVKMALIAVENVIAALSGQRPPHLVNPEVWEGGSC